MAATLSFLIRDGLESDIAQCIGLDHLYETDYVWQMSLHQEAGLWQVMFKTERLPRTLETLYPANQTRLQLALPDSQCFLVATRRETSEILGYVTMRNDAAYQIAVLQDLVVSRPYRQHGIGKRLLNVARQWAKEHNLHRMTIETQTKNYPGILFCQNAGFTFCGFNDRYLPHQEIAIFFSQAIR